MTALTSSLYVSVSVEFMLAVLSLRCTSLLLTQCLCVQSPELNIAGHVMSFLNLKDSGTRPVSTSLLALCQPTGMLTWLIMIGEDSTLELVEQAMKEQEERANHRQHALASIRSHCFDLLEVRSSQPPPIVLLFRLFTFHRVSVMDTVGRRNQHRFGRTFACVAVACS